VEQRRGAVEDVVVRSVLVTGAYGLLGSWLCRALVARGMRVAVLQRDQPAFSALALDGTEARCTVIHGDVRDLELLERALGEEEIDTVFHLAAQTIVGTAQCAPLHTFETNVRGTWMVLEACRRHEVARVVVASSDKAYGSHDALPYREEHELRPRFPYDVSKACADLIARSYWHSYGLPVAVTRCANLYGGGDLNPSRLVPEAVAAALAGRAPVIRSDGTPERDFVYVEDAVAANLDVADALDGDGARGEAFNVGWGRSWSVRDVVAAVCRAAGSDVAADIRGTGTPEGEIDRQWVDASRLRALTGWEPRVGLDDGLARTVAWYRAHPGALA
jgi:CDP-glucose 4,6-dehydratase